MLLKLASLSTLPLLPAPACRHDPQLQLTGIPTLMRWSPQGPGAKLGKPLEKCRQPQEAVAVVAEFMKQQGDQV